MAKLEKPHGLTINFKPSERQYELWNALQPNRCDHCGGTLTMKANGFDKSGNPIFKPVCSVCGTDDIPEQILGGGSAGGGKMGLLTSKVCTPLGFVQLGDIRLGDKITNPITGGVQEVIWLHPIEKHPFYRLHFIDGTKFDCSEGHLWTIHENGGGASDDKTWTTKRIFDWYGEKRAGMYDEIKLAVPLTAPVEFNAVPDKPINDAYTLGTIIGSARRTDSSIPSECLTASIEDRERLVRGVVATCGYSDGKGGVVCTLFNRQLAEDIAFVVRSLGGIASVITGRSKCDCYKVQICSADCKRHGCGDNTSKPGKCIADIEYIGIREGRCITVSDPSGLYVVDDFTITHNSFLGCCWLVYSCMAFPEIRMCVARKVRKTLLETTWCTLHDVLTSWGLKEDLHYHINQQSYVITFWNGSTIIAKELTPAPSDPDFNSLGSLEITGAFIDEVSEVSEKAVEVLASRIRYKVENTFVVGKIFLSTNPCLTWVRSTFVMDEDGGAAVLQKGYRYLPFSLFDNPDEKFRAVYYNKLSKIRDKATRDRLLYGNWLFVKGNNLAAYWNFDGNVHLKPSLFERRYDPAKPLILSFDFNVNPYMTCLPLQIDYENKVVRIFPEFIGRPREKRNNTPSFIRWISEKLVEWNHAGGTLVTGDPAGLARSTQTEDGVNNFTIVIKSLTGSNMRPKLQLLSKQPAQATRLEFVNGLFQNYEGWTVEIDTKCYRLVEDFAYQKRNPDGTKEKKKVLTESGERAEKYGHASDCYDYALVYYLSNAYTKYRSNAVSMITTIKSDEMVYGDFDY